jgi:hypothetical protein
MLLEDMLPLATIFMDIIVLSFSKLLCPLTISKDGPGRCEFFLNHYISH